MILYDASYGIIPLRKKAGHWEVLLVQHKNSHFWGFPKGHAASNETPQESAEREFHEETGLHVVRYLPTTPLKETYFFQLKGNLIKKNVHYFLAQVAGKERLQEEEIENFLWVPLDEAEKQATYRETKSLCRQTLEIVSHLQEMP